MSTKKTIAKSFTVSTIEDGVSVQAQYAPNANPTSSQIHTVWQNGDLYMRTRESDESAWSSWHKIVGESGDETDYSFGISQYKTTANASTAPSDISSWSDAPLAVTTAKPYLWSKVQKKSWNASTQSYDVDSTRYIRLTGEDGTSVLAQYAPNNNPTASQIHDTWQSGDLYMRTKSSSASTWSSWQKFVGESGDETDYSFNISKSKTSTNSTTAPSDCYYQTWQDAPVAPTSTYPYMWMKIVKKTWNESTQSYDSGTPSYARVTGEKGDDALTLVLDTYAIAFPTDSDYNVGSELTYTVGTKMFLGNNAPQTITSLTATSSDGDVYTSGTSPANGVKITIGESNYVNTVKITVTATCAKGSRTATINLTPAPQGEQGTRGKVGRFFYYAGAFDVTDSTTQFVVNDAQSPYFAYNNQYWVYNPETNPSGGTTTMAQMGTPSNSSADWKIMTNDFKYLITEAIFGSYAHFGSFIINGDWMISQHGVIYDTNGGIHTIDANHSYGNYNVNNAYTLFDVDYPNSSKPNANNFVPNFAVDGLTGKTYHNDAYIRGEVHATSGTFNGIVKAVLMYSPTAIAASGTWSIQPSFNNPACYFCQPNLGGSTIILPSPVTYDGLEISFLTPFGTRQTGSTWVRVDVNASYTIHFSPYDAVTINGNTYYLPRQDGTLLLSHNRISLPYNQLIKIKAINGEWYVIEGRVEASDAPDA